MAAFHDFTKPFRILEGKKPGDFVSMDEHPEATMEFLILGSERWILARGFGHIERLDDNPKKFVVHSIPWQNLPRSA